METRPIILVNYGMPRLEHFLISRAQPCSAKQGTRSAVASAAYAFGERSAASSDSWLLGTRSSSGSVTTTHCRDYYYPL